MYWQCNIIYMDVERCIVVIDLLEMAVLFTLIKECCVIIEKNNDKKLANRISYQIWYKRCLKGKFGTGSKSAKEGPNPQADLNLGSISVRGFWPGVQIRGGFKSAVTPARLSLVCYLTEPTNVHLEFHLVQILYAMGFGGTLTVKLFCVNTQGHK